jgi:hypothetical protein
MPDVASKCRLWNKIICVASGAGIAPVLPVLMQANTDEVYLLWITARPETFGPVMDILRQPQFEGR